MNEDADLQKRRVRLALSTWLTATCSVAGTESSTGVDVLVSQLQRLAMTDQSAVSVLSALADPTRRAIFEKLVEMPQPVGKLAEGFPVSRSAVSQHLRVLKDARLVRETAEGSRRIYRIDPRGIGVIRDWLDRSWQQAVDNFANYAE